MKKTLLSLLAAAFIGISASANMVMPGDMDHSKMDERGMKDEMPFEKKQERIKMHIAEMKSNMNQF